MAMNDRQTIKTEFIESDPTATLWTKKKILEDDVWVDRQYVRIYSKPSKGELYSPAEKWCRELYGPPKYLSKWFKVSDYIVMDEQVYFLWKISGE